MADFVVAPMLSKTPINSHNSVAVMGVTFSQEFGNGKKEKVDKIDSVWLSSFASFLSTFRWESGFNFVKNGVYIGWAKVETIGELVIELSQLQFQSTQFPIKVILACHSFGLVCILSLYMFQNFLFKLSCLIQFSY